MVKPILFLLIVDFPQTIAEVPQLYCDILDMILLLYSLSAYQYAQKKLQIQHSMYLYIDFLVGLLRSSGPVQQIEYRFLFLLLHCLMVTTADYFLSLKTRNNYNTLEVTQWGRSY